MRKFLVITALLGIVASTAWSGQVLKFSHNNTTKHPAHISMVQFAKDVKERSGGRYEIEIFDSAVLGNDTTVVEQLQGGMVEFMKVSASFLDSFEDTYSIFSLPYLFESLDHFYKVMNSDIVKPIYESAIDKDFLTVGYYTSGTRNFYTTNRAVRHADDLVGLKIRVMPSPTSIKMMEMLGAHATPLPFADVYTALQQGLLDGAENNELALIDMKHGEVSKYYCYDMHTMIPDLIIASTEFWNDLSDQDRQMFEECILKMTKYQVELWDEEVDRCKKEASETMGVEFLETDIKSFQEKVKPIIEEAMNDPKNPAKKAIIEAIIAAK